MTDERPYRDEDGPTIGHQGWTTKDQADYRMHTGESATLQTLLMREAEEHAEDGITSREMKVIYTDAKSNERHHGNISGALSVLDLAEKMVRLRERRLGNSVYVLPHFVNDRPFIPRVSLGPAATAAMWELTQYQILNDAGMVEEAEEHFTQAMEHVTYWRTLRMKRNGFQ